MAVRVENLTSSSRFATVETVRLGNVSVRSRQCQKQFAYASACSEEIPKTSEHKDKK